MEFRKRRLASDINVGVIYATAPVQAVVGEFSISGQVSASPGELWSRFADIGAASSGPSPGSLYLPHQVLKKRTPLPTIDG